MPATKGNAIIKVVAVAAIIGVLVYFAFRGSQQDAVVAEVRLDKAVDAVPGSVIVYADRDLQELKIEGAGRVVECALLDAGTSFKKGDILLRLDTAEIEREMADAKRNYATRRELLRIQKEKNNERELTVQKLANARRLQERGHASQENVNAVQRELDAIDTQLAVEEFSAKKEKEDLDRLLEANQLKLKKMTVIAPSDGIVEGALVSVGALVNSGTTVARFFSNDRVVIAKVGEEDIARVKIGDPGEVQLLRSPGRYFQAKVSKILPFADADTHRYSVYLAVDADPAQLVPNSTGEVVITVGSRDNVPLVPRRAIFNGANGTAVYVVKDGRLEERAVEMGYRSFNLAEITKGVVPGDRVLIVENLDLYRDGQRVRVVGEVHGPGS
jgi:RND family efflux transporter MFP subunit